jgi:hypothetical protein
MAAPTRPFRLSAAPLPGQPSFGLEPGYLGLDGAFVDDPDLVLATGDGALLTLCTPSLISIRPAAAMPRPARIADRD